MNKKRITSVAEVLYFEAYEATFGGKDRGRFLVSREHVKQLLGVRRLHASTTTGLLDACLKIGLVGIDMDDTFAFTETISVTKWRKLTSVLVGEYTNELDADGDDDDDEDEEIEDGDEDEDE